ncbi:MAG: SDR family oxidoreductase [Gammaproteobacteria bacterium]|nr:SDR family NAD(P)-dependent oxidoreductase [Gammaproteobacteria bacterium]MXW49997.1 SDR family oxidoreductase [Gammaproteobacteria bacterium]MYE51564.1 SDR family oxidoreductase [Gammaproteobacteria bacterium]MYF50359.1 SDR family oxidoreductase [Gammaproteobacteria bacterium]MYG14734.1 SDR family oxidoreductase [Gammaproteobacteria bacterium]
MGILDRFRLDGQVAVVTGGGRGIGEGLALGLAEAGADVVVAARRTHEIEAVADKVRALGRRALAVTANVMEIEQVQALADKAFAEMGALTCWVSNAGGADDRVPRTFLEMPERQWDFQLNLNLKAVWTGAQAAANIMKDHGGGTIINISSAAAGGAAPFNGPYAVAKSGVNNLTQTLAAEMAALGIRVNGVSPGPIPTEVFLEFLNLKEEEIPELGERFQIPLGRVGTPEDIAPAVVYLASEASSWMTGHTISIKGGP